MRRSINYSGFVDIVASSEHQKHSAHNKVAASMQELPEREAMTRSPMQTPNVDESESNNLT